MECEAALKRNFFLSRELFTVADEAGALDTVDANTLAVFSEAPSHDISDGRGVVDLFDRVVEFLGVKVNVITEEHGQYAPDKGCG